MCNLYSITKSQQAIRDLAKAIRDFIGGKTRQNINRISAVIPVVMSLLALGVVLVVVTTGWERGLQDEGAGAHIFQLLIVLQAPFILAFLATADWGRLMNVARPAAVQVATMALAIGSVALFQL